MYAVGPIGARAIFVQRWLTHLKVCLDTVIECSMKLNTDCFEICFKTSWTLQDPYVQQLYEVNLDSSWAHAQLWLWKCKLFEVSKHGKGSKMWGPGSVSKSFLAAWHLRCNEVRWSIRTLALCEITPLYQSWSIQLATAQSCGLTILSSWMTISR